MCACNPGTSRGAEGGVLDSFAAHLPRNWGRAEGRGATAAEATEASVTQEDTAVAAADTTEESTVVAAAGQEAGGQDSAEEAAAGQKDAAVSLSQEAGSQGSVQEASAGVEEAPLAPFVPVYHADVQMELQLPTSAPAPVRCCTASTMQGYTGTSIIGCIQPHV